MQCTRVTPVLRPCYTRRTPAPADFSNTRNYTRAISEIRVLPISTRTPVFSVLRVLPIPVPVSKIKGGPRLSTAAQRRHALRRALPLPPPALPPAGTVGSAGHSPPSPSRSSRSPPAQTAVLCAATRHSGIWTPLRHSGSRHSGIYSIQRSESYSHDQSSRS